ncbi:CPBP family intramembrane metalloprotease [Neobacillus notoginsengisoli]|uniref:CPBP family intramembrane metalloprotease n=1 Tax=Neobacillus notoginsengisoli TaxID=1578198 RepID=A0A417YZG4_9BACI|nr:CPBP family intramembrane glutamic endopeptidase [Neobacillus notoginsengisoli]RHW43309.1 CPBP family intramembrane metalloprotease [Neobacillus notoginsengisoli]
MISLAGQNKDKLINSIVTLIIMMILPLLVVSTVGVLLSITFSDFESDLSSVLIIGISMIFGFVFVPIIYIKKIYKLNLKDIGISEFSKREIIIETFVLLCLYAYLISSDMSIYSIFISSIQMLIVATTEEFWARGVICYLLNQIVENKWFIILASSLSFAFLTHMNEPFMDNLLYRLPGSVVMGVIFVYTKNLRYTILFHYIYNLVY